jgi:hypothetical protein
MISRAYVVRGLWRRVSYYILYLGLAPGAPRSWWARPGARSPWRPHQHCAAPACPRSPRYRSICSSDICLMALECVTSISRGTNKTSIFKNNAGVKRRLQLPHRGGVGIYQRHDWAGEKRAALDAWSAHLLAAAEGRLTAVKVLPFSRARAGEISMIPSREFFFAQF